MFGLPMWLLVFPVLGFLILIHELGHFLTAKWFGITVKEFGFGFPPRLIGFKFSRYGTIYSINVIPLGGFVRMIGENGEDVTKEDTEKHLREKSVVFIRRGLEEAGEIADEPPPKEVSFADQTVLKRAIVLCAGSFMNLLFPLVTFAILFLIPQDAIVGAVVINGVAPGSPAAQAGLREGDTVIAVQGRPIDNHFELIQRVMTRLGSPTEIEIRRGAFISGSLIPEPTSANTEIVTLVPRLNPPDLVVVQTVTDPSKEVSLSEARRYLPELEVGDSLTQGAVGIMIGTFDQHTEKRSYPVWDAVPMSAQKMWDVVLLTKNGVARWMAGGPDPGFAGPVGIARVTGMVAEVGGISPLIEFMALISISLGVINILPIPALDGGRLLFVIIEWARRGKRISPQREGLVHLVGFVVLISLIVVISYFDVVRLLNGDSLIR
ncbi:MAG: site-2 protease family protein [Chloroflexi bacterium]|nr:site-2 protease family protein [Chloroflexota bacterium]